jgi:hypothetical protein
MARRLSSLVAALAVVCVASPARAVLLDHGPGDPTLTFPIWYRDLNGLALQQCKSTTVSPNPAAAGGTMCFPLAPNPVGFPGNVGDELFYTDAVSVIKVPGLTFRYIAALEMAYASGAPVRGQEMVFARIRIVMSTTIPGTYKVTHPYGVEVFPDVEPGKRAVFFTEDVGLAPLNFEDALNGRVGPFLQWDVLNPGETLTVVTPLGGAASTTEEFIGDPNYDHTFTGSPFATNFIRIDGPPGSNLDGVGNDFVQTPLLGILGQKYLLPIATPLKITRASYGRDLAANITTVDVFATSTPTAKLVLSGTDLPTVDMKGDGAGRFLAHIELPGNAPIPSFVTVTNLLDNPAAPKTASLSDRVEIQNATFDTLTKTLSVTASSSDASTPAPALSVAGPAGGLMTYTLPGSATLSNVLASGIPPQSVTVVSSGGGYHTDEVLILPGLPDNVGIAPVAIPDTFIASENSTVVIDPLANDAVPNGAAAIIIISPPASGSAVASTVAPLNVSYKPVVNYIGPDSFTYAVRDLNGVISNVTTVTLDVQFTPFPATTVADDFALVQNNPPAVSSRTYNVIANDLPALGTTIDPASVAITTLPLHGTVVPNADGTVTYTPVAKFTGADSFAYTVKNNFGQVSAPATVSIVVFGGPEAVSMSKVIWTRAQSKWTLVGSTNWFGPALAHTTASCWIGKIAGSGALIGTAPVDLTGKFAVVVAPAPVGPDATNVITCQTSNGGKVSAPVTIN